MKFYCALIVFSLFAVVLRAQAPVMEDVIYLKNGGIMHGMIIEQVPNQSLKLQTADRNVWVYTFDQIEKITKEEVPGGKVAKEKQEPDEWDHGLFTFIIEGNVGIGPRYFSNNRRVNSYGGTMSFCVNLSPKFCVGVGAGYDAIDYLSFIPVFADVRYFFTTKPFTPYISAGMGYGIGPASNDDGGWYLNPNLGIRYNVAPKAALNVGVGYHLQTEKIRHTFYTFNFLNLKVGAIF